MRRNDPETAFGLELFQNRFGNGPSDNRFGTGSEFVDQDQRTVVGMAQDILHVEQMRAVGTQIVVDRLLIPDINKDALENSHL